MDNQKLKSIIEYYSFKGYLVEASDYGNGHINSTIRLSFDDNGECKQYVLQKLNRFVFPHPEEVMENCVCITGHLKEKIRLRGGDPYRESVTPIASKNGSYFYLDEDGEYWRVLLFVRDTISLDIADSNALMYETGLAFGGFSHDLSDFPAEKLHETVPHFHDTRKRFSDFEKVLDEDICNRVKDCETEIRFLTDRKPLSFWADTKHAEGLLPIHVTHNDTKLNNVMLDKDTHKTVCVIDLDTVMPGYVMHDFGDAIRTGACTAAEDEPDVSKVHLDLEKFDAFSRGFIKASRTGLTEFELKTLPMGAITITFEQAVRFLADYIAGDPYYKTAYPLHNLVRTRTQIKLLQEMEEKQSELQAIVEKYI